MSEYQNERWRGTVDATLGDHDRRLASLNGNLAAGAAAINSLAIEVATTRQRVAIYAAIAAGIASIAGSILAGALIYLLTGA